MLSSLIALPVLALSVAAAPQYGYGDASSSSSSMDMASMSSAAAAPTGTSNTTTAAGAVHTVVVGGGPLTYQPNFVNAAIGDQVIFEFHAKNHSVTQSSFAAPCTYLDAGLNSGFVPVSANATVFPSWALTVEVSTPLWFYCMQGNHCKEGMGFGINPPSSGGNTIEAFIAKAENTTVSNTTAPAITPSYNGTGIVAVNATGVAGVSSIAGSTSTAASAGATTTSTKSAGGKTVVGGLVALVAVAVGVIA